MQCLSDLSEVRDQWGKEGTVAAIKMGTAKGLNHTKNVTTTTFALTTTLAGETWEGAKQRTSKTVESTVELSKP